MLGRLSNFMRKCSTPPIDQVIYEQHDFFKNSDFSGGLNIYA